MPTVPFSIVIPTRQRHDTLKYAIESVLNQTFQDFELIIMDNFSTPETAEVVFSFGDDRIKYHRAPQRLSMTENWELALSHTVGEYVCFIGDDDGLIPDGLAVGQQLIEHSQSQLITWWTPTYHWDSYILPWNRNHLRIYPDQQHAEFIDSREFLIKLYNGLRDFKFVPQLYHGLVHRNIINKVKNANNGQYFLNSCLAPDIYAFTVNAYYSDTYLLTHRPLSIAGLSGHSNGTSQYYPSYDSKPSNEFFKEQKKEVMIHPKLVPSRNFCICIASDLLYIKDKFFPHDIEIQLNIRALVQQITSNSTDPLLFSNREFFNNREDVVKLAEKYGIDESEINFPEPITGLFTLEHSRHGPEYTSSGAIHGLNINCKLAGVNNVAQAAQLTWGILEGGIVINIVINTDRSELLQDKLVSQGTSVSGITPLLERDKLIGYLRQLRKGASDYWLSISSSPLDTDFLFRQYSGVNGKIYKALLVTTVRDQTFTDEEQNFLKDITTSAIDQGFDHPSFINYLLILMLYYYPHQFPQGWYDGVSIPEWFMEEFLRFLLVNPTRFIDQYDTESYYDYVLSLITYLHGKITTNRDSILWQGISKFVQENANFYLLNDSSRDLSQFQQQFQEIIEV